MGWVGGPCDFSVSPSTLGTNWVFKLGWTGLGLGLGGLGTKGLGTGLDNLFLWTKFWIWMFVQWRNSQTQRNLESKAKVCIINILMCPHIFLLSGIFPASRPTSSPTASSWSWRAPWTAASRALCHTWTAWTTQMEPRSSANSSRLGFSLGKRRSRVWTMCVSILQEMAGETVYYMIQKEQCHLWNL